MKRLPIVVATGMALAPGAAAAASAQWLAGPSPLETSPARNPDVAIGGGRAHIVYRVRSGGIGHLTSAAMELSTTPELLIPGSLATAAVTRSWNFPRVAVDESGAGHVVWGPLSTDPQKGTWYARIDGDGQLVIEAQPLTDRWVEDIDVAISGEQVHVLVNAIGDAPGVYDWVGPVQAGPTQELLVSPLGTFRELALHPHDDGLSAIGRFTQVERVDLGLGGAWEAVEHHATPDPPLTSIGSPRMVRAPGELWAAVGWIDAMPVSVLTQQDLGPWITLSADPPFDPTDADGGSPSLAVARDAQGRVAVAWLAASGDRLQVAIADPSWGETVALAGTTEVTSFEVGPDGDGFRAVFATDDGTLHTGRFGVPEPEDPEPLDDSGSGQGSASSDTQATSGGLGTSTTSEPQDSVGMVPGGSSWGPASSEGCDCDSGPRGRDGLWLAWLLPIIRRRPR